MNERQPKMNQDDFAAAFKKQGEGGHELVKQDQEDPVRGPTVQKVQALRKAITGEGFRSSAYADFDTFQGAFLGHFGDTEARRYRLFHLIIGSTPDATADLFDAEGEWSIEKSLSDIAEKHSITPNNI